MFTSGFLRLLKTTLALSSVSGWSLTSACEQNTLAREILRTRNGRGKLIEGSSFFTFLFCTLIFIRDADTAELESLATKKKMKTSGGFKDFSSW